MHQKVLYHLKKLKVEIQQNCKKCKAEGCTTCSSSFDSIVNYAKAGIPIKYWSLDLEDLSTGTLGVSDAKKYISKLDLAYQTGQGVYLFGQNGNGKTLAACAIGKKAIQQGYSVRFTFLGEIISAFVNSMYDNKQKTALQQDILEKDFLIIDDLDKAFVSKNSEYIQSILDSLFRTRVQNNLPVIITANKTLEDALSSGEEVFSKSLLSLFDESLLPILFFGPDRRAELKQEARKKFLDD